MHRPLFARVALIVALSALAACHEPAADDARQGLGDVELPGVDTRDLTQREKHEYSRYVQRLAAPCPAVAVPIAQCVIEKRACAACRAAALTIAKAVREGMSAAQVEGLYKQRFDASGVKDIPVDGSPARGPERPTVTLVEFADFECPFCQHIAPELDQIWDKRKGDVLFVFKFMPLSMHPHSELAARAAIAAQVQGKFWEMHHQLFANGMHLEASDLDGYAKSVGLDLDRFHGDMQSPATMARIDQDRKLADALGVKGTPTIFIDGREYDAKVDLADWLDAEVNLSHRGPK